MPEITSVCIVGVACLFSNPVASAPANIAPCLKLVKVLLKSISIWIFAELYFYTYLSSQ